MEKKIGKVAYRLELPPTCAIHLIFHVSQIRKAKGTVPAADPIPAQLTAKLEMIVEPEFLLGIRPSKGENLSGLEVLIQWKGLPPLEATWEPYSHISQQFPEFHLEDKVSLLGGSHDRALIQHTY